ncbi:MAG TPA: hypothetical protein VGD04_10915 [Methylophilus sp.]
MKYFIAVAIGIGLVMMLTVGRYEASQHITNNAITGLNEQSIRIQEKARQNAAESRLAAYKAEKVKVFVKGRDAKTCMKILKTEVLDNQVIECNKSRYVELRRDEVEQFKKDNEL